MASLAQLSLTHGTRLPESGILLPTARIERMGTARRHKNAPPGRLAQLLEEGFAVDREAC